MHLRDFIFTKKCDMQPRTGVLLFLTILSVVSGYLMSRASLVGRVGMSLFYRQYNFLKTWWKGTLVILIGLILLFVIHSLIQKRFSQRKARTIQLIICALAMAGLYFTYNDFRHNPFAPLYGRAFSSWCLPILDWLDRNHFFSFISARQNCNRGGKSFFT
nr:hypothetical protein [uncultured bacterium]